MKLSRTVTSSQGYRNLVRMTKDREKSEGNARIWPNVQNHSGES
jgi:hypothetical protein